MTTTPGSPDMTKSEASKSPFDELFARRATLPDIRTDSEPAPDTGRVYGYARVSRQEQRLERQIDALEKAGVPAENIFTDKSTGGDFLRPQFKKLCYSLEPGDTVKVTQLDRLGRNTKDTLRILAAFTELRVRFVVISLDLDTATPYGKFALVLFAAVAELEKDFVRERTLAGLESARRRGNYGGRVKKIDNKKAAEIMKWRFDYDLEVAVVAMKVKVSESTVYRFLREKAESDAEGSDAFYDKYGLDNYTEAMPDKGDELADI